MPTKDKKKRKKEQKPLKSLPTDDVEPTMKKEKKKNKKEWIMNSGKTRINNFVDKEEEGEERMKKRKKNLITDPRFVSANFDPRFQRMPKREWKIPIDSRFSRMLTDKNFETSSAPVDIRGKRRKKKGMNPLLHYYLHQEDEVEERKEWSSESGEELELGAFLAEDDEVKKSEKEDDARDENSEISVSDETSSTDDEGIDDEENSVNSDIVRYLMASHEDTPLTDKETHRLAIVNLDWDHIKAVDLYVIMSSCLPKGGQVLSVAIYPSEFGHKCMEIEAAHGPSALLDDLEEDSEEDSDIVNEKFRTYELNKLRYFYAVVVCDSSATANHLYNTLDGTELLKTSNVFDLRFIPDSMEFKHPPRDITTEAPTSYKEPDFHTRALQHSRVKLTWEEDEPERKKILRRKFNLNQLDELNEYLASSTDSDEENNKVDDASILLDGEARKNREIEKFRALLQSEKDSDADGSDDKHMEITFNTDLEDLSKRIAKKKDKASETVWESVLRKRSEKKKARKNRSKHSDEDDSSDYDSQEAANQSDDFFVEELRERETKVIKKRSKPSQSSKNKDKHNRKGRENSPKVNKEQEATRAELELLFADDQVADKGPKGYNLKPKKIKGKKGKEEAAEEKLPNVNISDDPRFRELFSSHLYALDPTDPQYKRSAAYIRQRSKKQTKGSAKMAAPQEILEPSVQDNKVPARDDIMVPTESSEKEKNEFFSTVRSLKRNVGTLKNQSKNR